MFYTYVHTRNDTGKIFYIGKGTGPRAWKTTRRNKYWKSVQQKHGITVEVLAHWDTEAEALDHEKLLIACFRDMGYKLANMTDGGEGTTGFKYTPELREIRRMAWSGKNNPNFGKNLATSTKEKVSKTKRDQKLLGAKCSNFKCSILATNIKTGNSFILSGTAEMEAAGFQNTNIFKCLNGKRKTHKGYSFKRLEK
jgi:hypothetical protein